MSQNTKFTRHWLQKNPQLRALQTALADQQALLSRVRKQLPEPLQGHCLGARLDRNRLILLADSSAWASRLRFMSRHLQHGLSDEGLAVQQITVRVFLDNRPHAPRPVSEAKKISPVSAALLEQTADSIDDPELKAALKRLSRHGTTD